jgi:hypothetical protein
VYQIIPFCQEPQLSENRTVNDVPVLQNQKKGGLGYAAAQTTHID